MRAVGRLRGDWIAVTADLVLVAETGAAALSGMGLDTRVVGWRRGLGGPRRAEAPALTLLICDLRTPGRLEEARQRGRPGPWLVMTDEGPGPAWGAMLDAGARAVVPSTISLDQLTEMLRAVLRGEESMDEAQRRQLLRSWEAVGAERAGIRRRMETLSPRERRVLAMLYEGTTVRDIAEQLEVSEATVRSQVKAVLRKLAVASQLAAVAAVDELRVQRRAGG